MSTNLQPTASGFFAAIFLSIFLANYRYVWLVRLPILEDSGLFLGISRWSVFFRRRYDERERRGSRMKILNLNIKEVLPLCRLPRLSKDAHDERWICEWLCSCSINSYTHWESYYQLYFPFTNPRTGLSTK